MKKQLIAAGLAVGLAVGCISVASANPIELINNGTFGATTPTHSTPTQFRNNTSSCGISGRTYGGQFVDGWTATQGYAVWYPSASAASGTQACTQFGNTGNQLLPTTVTGAPSGTATFVGMDGEPTWRAQISQTISGLAHGTYTVSFWWASTQELSRSGPTTEQFQVSLGDDSFLTDVNSIDTHGWSGWAHVTGTLHYTSGSPILSFLSIGTPGGLPPFALLSDVSMHAAVPEPSELGLFGAGLLGLGFLTLAARRRALRRKGAHNAFDIR